MTHCVWFLVEISHLFCLSVVLVMVTCRKGMCTFWRTKKVEMLFVFPCLLFTFEMSSRYWGGFEAKKKIFGLVLGLLLVWYKHVLCEPSELEWEGQIFSWHESAELAWLQWSYTRLHEHTFFLLPCEVRRTRVCMWKLSWDRWREFTQPNLQTGCSAGPSAATIPDSASPMGGFGHWLPMWALCCPLRTALPAAVY